MNKIKFLTAAVILLLVLNAVMLFFMFGKRGGKRAGGWHDGGRPYSEFISKQLNFDTLQKAQLLKLRDAHKTEIDQLRKEDNMLHDSLFACIKRGGIDSAKIDSVTNLIAANKKQFELTFTKHFMQIRAICRPDQLELFNKTVDQMRKRRMPSFGDRDKKSVPPASGH